MRAENYINSNKNKEQKQVKMSMDNLEQQLIGSRKVREFLKHFSESQWSRVIKATVIMGIQDLERTKKIHNLSCKDLEDIVVMNETSIRSDQNSQVQNPQPEKQQIQILQKIQQQQAHAVEPQLTNYGQPEKITPQDFQALPGTTEHVSMRRGGRPTQGGLGGQQQNGSRRGSVSHGNGGGAGKVFRKPHFIQGLTATVTSRQNGLNPADESLLIDNANIETFGDQDEEIQKINQPQRAQSVPQNMEKPALQSYALPQEKPKVVQQAVVPQQEQPNARRVKPTAIWREKRQPNFSKIGDKNHEQRFRSEQTRLISRNKAAGQGSAKGELPESRRKRNCLPTQPSGLANQRAQSLNPLVYPSWWGDGDKDEPKHQARNKHSPKDLSRKNPQNQQPIMSEQPRIRNQQFQNNADPYINTQSTEQTLLQEQQAPYNVQYEINSHPQHYQPNQHPQQLQGSFQMAAHRQQTQLEMSMTQHSSTTSLADALQQAKATADRLQRDLDNSKKQRAELLHQGQNYTPVNIHLDNQIVDIRNEDHIQRQHQLQTQQIQHQQQQQQQPQRNRSLNSRNSSSKELQINNKHHQQKQHNNDSSRGTRSYGQENFQRNGSRQQLHSNNPNRQPGGGAANVILQHSPPRTTKAQQVRQQYNSQQARNRELSQNRNTSSGSLPSYLKNVTSKIGHQVRQDKQFISNTCTQNVPVEIFVGPPPSKKSKRQKNSNPSHQQHPNEEQTSYEDSYGRLVKLKYQQSDINQQYAIQHQDQQHLQQQQINNYQYHPQQDQQYHQQQQQYSVQDPAIINHEQQQPIHSARQQNQQQHMGELCQDLLDSPYVQKFANELQAHHYGHHPGQNDSSSLDQSSFQQRQDMSQQPQQPMRNVHDYNQTTTDQDESTISAKQADDSTIQTHHLNAMSNHVTSSKNGGNQDGRGVAPQGNQQPHMFSVENSSSMVMYNATVRNQGTGLKTDTSANYNYQNGGDPTNFLMSQQSKVNPNDNQLFFDSKAFDQLPSQTHQINSQTGAAYGGIPSSHNNMTTLDNKPLSMDNPTISASSQAANEDHQRQQTTEGQQHQQHQHQYRFSGYQAPSASQQQQQIRPVSAYNNRQEQEQRNQTGHDLQKMRQYPQQQQNHQHQQQPEEQQNFSKLIEQVDRMQSEETKIMTFKSHDNGFLGQHSQLPPNHQQLQQQENQRFYDGGGRINQTQNQNNDAHQHTQQQNQFEPGTTYDKRGSVNTLSQMTNPFRTQNLNRGGANNANHTLAQSEITRGQYQYQGGVDINLKQSQDNSQIIRGDDDFSSPEENKTMTPHINNNPNKQESQTDNDPSSSSMSGYDMRGILNRARNQAKNVQNNVLKADGDTVDHSPLQQPSELYGDRSYRHQHNVTNFSQPGQEHQFMSQNVPSDQAPFSHQVSHQAQSHLVSQQNLVSSGQHAADQAPSSYHPVISQDFNPLKTTIGNQEDMGPNSSGLKSQEESKRHDQQNMQHQNPAQFLQQQPMTQQSSSYPPSELPQFSAGHHQRQESDNSNVLAKYLPQQVHSNQVAMGTQRSSKADLPHNKISHRGTDDQQTELTENDDSLSDYSSSAQDLAQSSRNRQMQQQSHHGSQKQIQQEQSNSSQHQLQNQGSFKHLGMPRQVTPQQQQQTQSSAHSYSQQQKSSALSVPVQYQQNQQKNIMPSVNNFMAPPAQIHQESVVADQNDKLEHQMQDFINSQKILQAQSQPQIINANISQQQQQNQMKGQNHQSEQVIMQFNPPKGQLKPMTDTETSSDDDDLSSGSGLTGTDTSGIDTSSMSQSLQSSVGVKGLLAAAHIGAVAGKTSMPRTQSNNQYPAMAFQHPKYAGTMQQHQP